MRYFPSRCYPFHRTQPGSEPLMTQPIGADLFRHLRAVGDPTVSPDGSRCAYVLSWIDAATSSSRSRIYHAGPPVSTVRTMTRNPSPAEMPILTRGFLQMAPRWRSCGPAAPARTGRSRFGQCRPGVGRLLRAPTCPTASVSSHGRPIHLALRWWQTCVRMTEGAPAQRKMMSRRCGK